MADNDTKTYLFDSTEIALTGRVATRNLRQGKIDVLLEIKPVGPAAASWTKWVRQAELYEIEDQ